MTERWIAQAGAQFVRAERDLRNRTMPNAGYSRHFTRANPKLGVIYRWSDSTQAYANLSRSFEAPPFGELVVRPMYPLASAQKAT